MSMASKIVEFYSVSPSHGAAAVQSFPLQYFDMLWFTFPPVENLHFYPLRCSERCFLETIAVELKNSLSVALKYFLPLASKIIFPLTSSAMPVSRYASGDSVALTIAISNAGFANMTENHPKDADQFHHLVPQMPPAVYSADDIRFSVMAIQVTLFPNQGICIGFTQHHAICDGTSLLAFVRTWASLHKFNGDDQRLDPNLLPFYGRDCVQDGSKLSNFIWNEVRTTAPNVSLTLSLPLLKLRATFVLSEAEIEKLKKFATNKNPTIGRVSTFVAVCAHLWSCLAKSAAAIGEGVDDNEAEYFTTPINCRARLNPPLSDNYFGNCLMLLQIVSTHGRLKGNEGFVAAVEAIAAGVFKTARNERTVSEYFQNRSDIVAELIGKRVVTIAGSSKFDQYDVDYGWGRAIKFECIQTDFTQGVNVCKGRDGGVEIGLSLPNAKMVIFASLFNNYLNISSNL